MILLQRHAASCALQEALPSSQVYGKVPRCTENFTGGMCRNFHNSAPQKILQGLGSHTGFLFLSFYIFKDFRSKTTFLFLGGEGGGTLGGT